MIFDMYETLVYNNSGLWIDTFGAICHKQGLGIGPEELYREWKALEMGFRRDRPNLQEPDKSPPFKSYEQAWRECFARAFSKLGLEGDAGSAARDAVRDMGLREPYQDALQALPVIQTHWRTGLLSNADDGYLFPLLERRGWEFEGGAIFRRGPRLQAPSRTLPADTGHDGGVSWGGLVRGRHPVRRCPGGSWGGHAGSLDQPQRGDHRSPASRARPRDQESGRAAGGIEVGVLKTIFNPLNVRAIYRSLKAAVPGL